MKNRLNDDIALWHWARARQAKSGVSWSSYCTPLGWTWALPITIQRNGGTFRVDPSFDLETYANISVSKTYYVATDGNDSNDGLTALTPLKKLSTALGKADVDRVYMAAGWYVFGDGANGINPVRSVKIIGVGDVYLSSDAYTYATGWALVDNHYEATWAAGACSVIDISATDSYNDFQNYTLAADVAGVDSTPGSFIVSGGKLYIRTLTGNAPNNSFIKVLYGINGLDVAKDSLKYYFENLNFYTYKGNTVGNNSATGGLKFYAKDCDFMYAGVNSNNLNIIGVDETILQGCRYAHGMADGLSMAVKNTKITNVIEIDCAGYDNGLSTGTAFNGSTLHGGCIGVRLNCEYQHNRGSNIHDVDSSTMSLNLAVNSHNAEPSGAPANYLRANFSIGSGNSTAKMWCDTCVSTGSYRDYVASGLGVILYKHGCTGDAEDEEISSGEIIDY